MAVEAKEQVSADDRQYAKQNGQDRASVHLHDDNHRVDNREGSSPDQEEAAESHAGGSLPVAGTPETPSGGRAPCNNVTWGLVEVLKDQTEFSVAGALS